MKEQDDFVLSEGAILQEIELYKQEYLDTHSEEGEEAWRGQFFNNFVLFLRPHFRDFFLDERRRDLTPIQVHQYTAEEILGSGHSQRLLRNTYQAWYADVDAAIEAAGVNVDDSLKAREEKGNVAALYSTPGWQEAYIALRLQGYNHRDITG